ncbi:hypothetical protein BX600DRAFT_470251 [Xylariales sp. PMI_506]|nr:hypothetical protein BX600DRAFT_470251 [Xylariales sp. PMI_506]
MASDASRTDIIISIYPKHVTNIVEQTKNHEFRKYLIPKTVTRMWIYETAPVSAIRYCAVIEPGKEPGEISEDDLEGINNRKFNNGETLLPGGSGSKYAYKITELFRLKDDIPLAKLKEKGWAKGAPQMYNYAPPEMVAELGQGLVKKF